MKYNKLEYNSALFLSSISLFLGVGISKIINSLGSDSWIAIILGTMIGLIINYIFSKLPDKENKILTYVYSFIILLINLLLITKLISSIYLNKTPDIIVMLPLIFIVYYSASKGINTIFKASLIICFVYLLITIIPVAALTPKIDIDNFKPFFTSDMTNIIKSSLDYAFISTAPFILFNKFKKNYNYKTYLLSSSLLLLIFIIIIGNLGVNLAKLYRYPEYMVFKEISILGFIENIQNILSYLWLFCSFVLSSVAANNIKKVSNKTGLIIALILITILLTKVILNNYIYTEYITKYYGEILLSTIGMFIVSKLLGNSFKDME